MNIIELIQEELLKRIKSKLNNIQKY